MVVFIILGLVPTYTIRRLLIGVDHQNLANTNLTLTVVSSEYVNEFVIDNVIDYLYSQSENQCCLRF